MYDIRIHNYPYFLLKKPCQLLRNELFSVIVFSVKRKPYDIKVYFKRYNSITLSYITLNKVNYLTKLSGISNKALIL